MGISTPGIGSGLDINGMVSKLMNVEKAPLNLLEAKRQAANNKLSALATIKGALSDLQNAAQALSSQSSLFPASATSSDATTVSGMASAGATPGTYRIEVSTLAAAQQLTTGSTYAATSTPVGSGTLRITIGDTNTDIAIGSTANTLRDLKDAVNAANIGVTATLVSGDGQARLLLTAKQTGTANAFTVSNPGGGLESLTGALSSVTAAADATVTVNGTPVRSAGNTITSAIDNVTFTALKTTSGTPVTLTVANNTAATRSALDRFVQAYNSLTTQLTAMGKYDPQTKVAGPLNGEAVIQSLQTQLSKALTTPVLGITSGPTRLADIGITRQKDGTLLTDSAALASTLEDPSRPLAALLLGGNGITGVGTRMKSLLGTMQASNGSLTSRTDGLNKSIKNAEAEMDREGRRLQSVQKRYLTQFTTLDAMLTGMNSTSEYLKTQFDSLSAMNKSK